MDVGTFKAGDFDWRTENVAKNSATGYDFPAVTQQRVVLEEFPIDNVGIMQAFAFNTRRSKLSDARLRRAFNFAFDFESRNRDIFYGQYARVASYFQSTELACSGLPERREFGILTPLIHLPLKQPTKNRSTERQLVPTWLGNH